MYNITLTTLSILCNILFLIGGFLFSWGRKDNKLEQRDELINTSIKHVQEAVNLIVKDTAEIKLKIGIYDQRLIHLEDKVSKLEMKIGN